MNIKLIINKLQTIPKWYGWIMVIIYSLLLAEFISTLNNLIMYGVVLSNIYEVFMKLGYFITIISGIAVWLVTMLLFHLTALLFDGNASFNSLLRISPYPYIIPAIAVLVAIILLGQISVDRFENFGASIGRIYKINKSGTFRANISLGVGYTHITEPENWEKINNNPVSITKNYSYDNVKHGTVSLIVSPKIEFPITRYFGFTVSPMLQINRDRIYYGIGIGSMIGLLRK